MTVRLECMIQSPKGQVLQNWTTQEGSIINDPQIYTPRAYQIKRRQNATPYTIRVRVVDEQTNRIVDLIQ